MARRSSGDVRVSVGAEVSDLRRGMDEAGGLVRSFKSNSERAGGTVRYLSEAMTALTGESGAAGRAVGVFSGVLGGLAQGGVAGAVFAGIGGLIQVFKSFRQESSQAAEAAKTKMDEFGRSVDAATLKLEKQAYVAAGGSAQMFDAMHSIGASVDYMTQLREREAEAYAKIQAAHNAIASAMVANNPTLIKIQEEALAGHEAEKKKIQDEIALLEKKRATIIEEAATAVAAEKAKATAKTDTAAAEAMIAQLRLDNKNDADRVKASNEAVMAQARLEGEIEAARTRMGEEAQKTEQERREEGERLYSESLGRQAADLQALRERQISSAEQIGTAYGQMFGAIVTGQMTVRDAMIQTTREVLQMVLQAAIKSIMAKALSAGAGAAESQASIPYVGPILAVAAMTAMIATVSALVGQIGARASGGSVTAGRPYLVGELGPELMVPGASGTIVPNSALGRGGGFQPIIVLPNVFDAQGYRRQQKAFQRETVRFLRELERDGKL